MSCHVMSCHVMLCHVMSCHVISYELVGYDLLLFDLIECVVNMISQLGILVRTFIDAFHLIICCVLICFISLQLHYLALNSVYQTQLSLKVSAPVCFYTGINAGTFLIE